MNAALDPDEPVTKKQEAGFLRGLDLLLVGLEALAFVQIAILYSVDNSTISLFLRCLSQTVFVSCERGPLRTAPPLAPVLLANAFFVLIHLISPRPKASTTTTRGYLHGSIIIDFVGELGPISKWRLLSLDALVLLLQLLMLVMALEKEKAGDSALAHTSREAHEDEALEAGLLRTGPQEQQDRNNDIGLQGLDRDISTAEEQSLNMKPLSRTYKGEQVLVTIDLLENMKTLMHRRPQTTGRTDQSLEDIGLIGRVVSRIAEARSRTRSG